MFSEFEYNTGSICKTCYSATALSSLLVIVVSPFFNIGITIRYSWEKAEVDEALVQMNNTLILHRLFQVHSIDSPLKI